MADTIPLTQESLINYLKGKNIPAQTQPETGQIYFMYKSDAGDFPIFFRIYDKDTHLQILTFFPTQFDPPRFPTAGRLLCDLNNQIDLPGFGLDERMGVVFHRIMIPIFESQVPIRIIDLYMNALPALCDHFDKILKKVLTSSMSFEEYKKTQGKPA